MSNTGLKVVAMPARPRPRPVVAIIAILLPALLAFALGVALAHLKVL